MLRPKKNSYKEFDNEKNSCGSKIPHPPPPKKKTVSNSVPHSLALGDYAEKHVLKLVERFSGHCRAIKS